MPNNAFVDGIKPGGLTTVTEIKILLCYMLRSVSYPLTLEDITSSLLAAKLVNYFEIPTALADLVTANYITETGHGYEILPMGKNLSELLENDLPLTVRETALNGVLYARQFSVKEKQHKASITSSDNEYTLHCQIDELGKKVFSMDLLLPDLTSAEYAKKKFIENGADVFLLFLAGLTGNKDLALDYFTQD